MENLFYKCTGLNIEIPAELFATAQNVTSFAGTFYGCSNLTGTIPDNLFIKNRKVENFSNTFSGCENLTGMIPEDLLRYKSQVTTVEGMFEGCKKLTAGEIILNTDRGINMNNMFKNCEGLESLVFGEHSKNLTGTSMFEGASALRAIILLNDASEISDVGIASNLSVLGLRDEAIIYVPYRESEKIYERVWTNISADRIEQVVKGNEPNPDYVDRFDTYVDETGYSVAGFGMNETEKYTQYGFSVEISGMPVDTTEIGSEFIVYTLYKE